LATTNHLKAAEERKLKRKRLVNITIYDVKTTGSGVDSLKVSVEWRNLVDGDVWAVAYERCLTVIEIP